MIFEMREYDKAFCTYEDSRVLIFGLLFVLLWHKGLKITAVKAEIGSFLEFLNVQLTVRPGGRLQ